MNETDRDDLRAIDAARRAHPEWSRMLNDQLSATMTAVLRNCPYSWLTREHVLKWLDDL